MEEARREGRKERDEETNNKGRKTIARIREEKEEEEEDLIELRAIDEMVSRWFHKYLRYLRRRTQRGC